ncbi:MAG: Mur ligase family protein [Actinomycetota bacterium]|nr:Mur ligase family protein [Actinomycetota bacterium]
MKKLEEYLNSKIGLTNNKNLEVLHRFFTEDQLKYLMDKTIAIVGTNGKTSTANFIYKLLSKEKKQVLMFTSPHLVNFQERIRSHIDIDFDFISRFVHEFEIENNITLGYFETLFLIACKSFLDNEMDYFICEAGIGGVLDTTSVIQSKNVVLTNIGQDHQDLLGYTDPEVLNQKIFVSNNIDNLFVGDLSFELNKAIEDNYEHYKSKYSLMNFVEGKLKDFTSTQLNYLLASLVVNFLLSFNTKNITLQFNQEFVEGRFEIINRNPLKILDGAHNIDGFIKTIEDYEKVYSLRDTHLYLGFKNGKNIEKIINYLMPKKQYKLNFIEENTFFNQQNPDKFTNYLESKIIDYKIVELSAFSSNKNPSILIGSLYLIGEYKKRITT